MPLTNRAGCTAPFRSRVLPHLAARLGALSYRPAEGVSTHWINKLPLFQPFDSMNAENEIFGTYKDVPLRIIELRLDHGAGDDRRLIFDGLLIEIVLPRRLNGTTAVVHEQGIVPSKHKRLRARDFRASGLERVHLEDPEFEKAYEVFGSDQIEARALLTPAFMVRFLDLSRSGRFARPVAAAEGNRLCVALPKNNFKSLFEPPHYTRPVGGGAVLAELSRDIQAVLNIADAVIALDSGLRSSSL